MTELAVFAIVVSVVLVMGNRVGMLVAPRLGRWTEADDEEPNDE